MLAVLCLPQHNLRGVLLTTAGAAVVVVVVVGPLCSCQLSRQLHHRKWWNTALVVLVVTKYTNKVGTRKEQIASDPTIETHLDIKSLNSSSLTHSALRILHSVYHAVTEILIKVTDFNSIINFTEFLPGLSVNQDL